MPFVRLSEPLADACIATLGHHLEQGRQFYALIDLAAATDAAHWHAALARTSEAHSLFVAQPESAAALQAPWLLRLDVEARPSLRHTVDEGLVAWNVVWIASELSSAELARRLSQRLTANLPEGEALFRYYDPRLLPAWWRALPVDRRACFGAFGTQWWTLDAACALHAMELAGEPEDDPVHVPWQPSPTELQALTQASELQQLVGFLGKRCPETFLDKNRGEQWQFARTHDANAKLRGITHLADRLRYCELALAHGEGFADRADWQPLWASMTSKQQRLIVALEQFTPVVASPTTPRITA